MMRIVGVDVCLARYSGDVSASVVGRGPNRSDLQVFVTESLGSRYSIRFVSA